MAVVAKIKSLYPNLPNAERKVAEPDVVAAVDELKAQIAAREETERALHRKVLELRYFIDHLDGSPIEIADGQNCIEVLEIVEQAATSLLSGEPVRSAASGPAAATDGVFVHPSSFVDYGVEIA